MISLDITNDALKQASSAEREQIVEGRIFRAIRNNDFEYALGAIEELPKLLPASPLHALKARALLALGRANDAIAVLEQALVTFPATGQQQRLAELLWLSAQARLQRGERAQAANFLTQLVAIASSLSSGLALVQALTELIDVGDDERATKARRALAVALGNLRDEDADREPSLIRLALTRMGPAPVEPWQRWAPKVCADLWLRSDLAVLSAEAMDQVATALQASRNPDLRALTSKISNVPGQKDVMLVGEAMLRAIQQAPPDLAAIVGMWELFKAEQTSLSASTLYGMDAERLERGFEAGLESMA